MRVYIDGKLSVPQSCFLPSDLWFANDEAEDNDCLSADCFWLEGEFTESTSDKDTGEFSCRWKGVYLHYINAQGDEIETEDFTFKEFMELITNHKMRLANMSAFLDKDTNVIIESIVFDTAEGDFEFPIELIDTIQFDGCTD